MIKFSVFLLFLTLPLLDADPVLGVPMWVWGSLGATAAYALLLIVAIERRWEAQKGDDDA